MARIVPSDISKPALAGGATRELATLAELEKQLPDDYTVFHGVHWTREYAKWRRGQFSQSNIAGGSL